MKEETRKKENHDFFFFLFFGSVVPQGRRSRYGRSQEGPSTKEALLLPLLLLLRPTSQGYKKNDIFFSLSLRHDLLLPRPKKTRPGKKKNFFFPPSFRPGLFIFFSLFLCYAARRLKYSSSCSFCDIYFLPF